MAVRITSDAVAYTLRRRQLAGTRTQKRSAQLWMEANTPGGAAAFAAQQQRFRAQPRRGTALRGVMRADEGTTAQPMQALK